MKTKITTIVIDTNVYGWYLAYALDGSRRAEAINSFGLLLKILELKKPVVLGTETVEKEIKAANNPTLSELFYSIVSGIIKKTERAEKLALNYYDYCRKEKLNLVTIADCKIVASALIAGTKIFVTENRKTLNNPRVVKAVGGVNSINGLGNVRIMDSKNALGELYA